MSRLRKLTNDRLSGLMLLALAAFVAWQNRAYPLGTLQEPGPGYTPLLIAAFLGLIGVIIVLRGGSSPGVVETSWREAPRALVILIACGVAAYALEPLGYRQLVSFWRARGVLSALRGEQRWGAMERRGFKPVGTT